jgi:hypothetical protein
MNEELTKKIRQAETFVRNCRIVLGLLREMCVYEPELTVEVFKDSVVFLHNGVIMIEVLTNGRTQTRDGSLVLDEHGILDFNKKSDLEDFLEVTAVAENCEKQRQVDAEILTKRTK